LSSSRDRAIFSQLLDIYAQLIIAYDSEYFSKPFAKAESVNLKSMRQRTDIKVVSYL
jgi:hypothetical protein